MKNSILSDIHVIMIFVTRNVRESTRRVRVLAVLGNTPIDKMWRSLHWSFGLVATDRTLLQHVAIQGSVCYWSPNDATTHITKINHEIEF